MKPSIRRVPAARSWRRRSGGASTRMFFLPLMSTEQRVRWKCGSRMRLQTGRTVAEEGRHPSCSACPEKRQCMLCTFQNCRSVPLSRARSRRTDGSPRQMNAVRTFGRGVYPAAMTQGIPSPRLWRNARCHRAMTVDSLHTMHRHPVLQEGRTAGRAGPSASAWAEALSAMGVLPCRAAWQAARTPTPRRRT